MLLKRVATGNGVSVYRSESGETYLLKPVDRKYEGKAKPPRYYLSLRQPGGKAKYLSGVFPTRDMQVFSLDMRDGLGVKVPWRMVFLDAGTQVVLEQGKASDYLREPELAGVSRA